MEKVWLSYEEKLINWLDEKEDFYDKLEYIKQRIGFQQVNDQVLDEWAKSLVSSIFDSEDISANATYLVNGIIKQESNCYYRWMNGYEEEENDLLFEKWQKLRSSVCKELGSTLFSCSLDSLNYIQELSRVGADNEVEKAKADFRLKYGECLDDMDAFFAKLKIMDGREFVNTYYKKHFQKSVKNFKYFFNEEIQAVVPERKGERGWNYEALIKYV